MEISINPFPISNYISKEYFCDRKKELKLLLRNAENGINTTLISVRRYGKSALIKRLFEEISSENDEFGVYIDLYATRHFKDFTEIVSLALMQQFPEKKSLGKKFLAYLKGFRPIISYDALTGQPEIQFEFKAQQDYERTLSGILQFLDSQNKQIIIALDEFQQVANYPESNTEAILRTIIQNLKNIRFIFSGSNKHLMIEIFNNAKRPFFSSTQTIGLQEIDSEIYDNFIKEKFNQRKREISQEAIDFIIDWTLRHTYYTQMVCNQVYATRKKKIDIGLVKEICNEILISQHSIFIQYRNLLTPNQWELMIAIAKEEKLIQPQSKTFLQKYQLGAASSVQKSLDILLSKEMVFSVNEENAFYYRVYDLFLMRWLQLTY